MWLYHGSSNVIVVAPVAAAMAEIKFLYSCGMVSVNMMGDACMVALKL
jgi:hypothetical protein